MDYLFTIFHRLNSGGVRLNNQEIRNCIYSGSFNDALKEFDRKDQSWLQIKKRIWGSPNRFRSVELLLRALAFSEKLEDYDGNLSRYLNLFMHDRVNLSEDQISKLNHDLAEMSKVAVHAIGRNSFSKISMTFIEATLVGILFNLNTAKNLSKDQLKERFQMMMSEPTFSEAAKYAIASEMNVKKRMKTATTVFSRT